MQLKRTLMDIGSTGCDAIVSSLCMIIKYTKYSINSSAIVSSLRRKTPLFPVVDKKFNFFLGRALVRRVPTHTRLFLVMVDSLSHLYLHPVLDFSTKGNYIQKRQFSLPFDRMDHVHMSSIFEDRPVDTACSGATAFENWEHMTSCSDLEGGTNGVEEGGFGTSPELIVTGVISRSAGPELLCLEATAVSSSKST
ncbi:hypothetical protein Tco_1483711 [Tanacetum coccineum]